MVYRQQALQIQEILFLSLRTHSKVKTWNPHCVTWVARFPRERQVYPLFSFFLSIFSATVIFWLPSEFQLNVLRICMHMHIWTPKELSTSLESKYVLALQEFLLEESLISHLWSWPRKGLSNWFWVPSSKDQVAGMFEQWHLSSAKIDSTLPHSISDLTL